MYRFTKATNLLFDNFLLFRGGGRVEFFCPLPLCSLWRGFKRLVPQGLFVAVGDRKRSKKLSRSWSLRSNTQSSQDWLDDCFESWISKILFSTSPCCRQVRKTDRWIDLQYRVYGGMYEHSRMTSDERYYYIFKPEAPCRQTWVGELAERTTDWMGQGPSHLTKIPITTIGGGPRTSNPNNNSILMNPADFGFTTDTIKVEHGLTIHLGDKLDRPIRKISESLSRLAQHWAESFRIIAIGLSAYFVLSGLAKLVAATKSTDPPPDSSTGTKGRSSSSRRIPIFSSKRSKKSSSSDKSIALETIEIVTNVDEDEFAPIEDDVAPAMEIIWLLLCLERGEAKESFSFADLGSLSMIVR